MVTGLRFGVTALTDDLPSPAQVRAARALLAWSQNQLGKASGTSRRTLATFEAGGTVSIETICAMKTAFEANGIEFIREADSEGVRRRGL